MPETLADNPPSVEHCTLTESSGWPKPGKSDKTAFVEKLLPTRSQNE
jgi:hypothetical protein